MTPAGIPLLERSDTAGLVQLAGHLGALAVTAAAVYLAAGSPWLVPALLLHGVVLVFLFTALHECIHRTAFRRRWLNDAVAWLAGAVLMLPPRYFRAFHFAHHRHTQDPRRDPELAAPRPSGWKPYLWYVTGLPYWVERIATLGAHAAGRVREPFIGAAVRPAVVAEARALITVYAGLGAVSLAAGSPALLLYWVGPALLGQPLLRLYLLAEHTGCPLTPDPLANSRTVITNPLVRRLAWNMPYHVEHHRYPGVPFHRLPALHEELRGHIVHEAAGYLAVHRELVARNHPGKPGADPHGAI